MAASAQLKAEIDRYQALVDADPKSRAFAPLGEAYRKAAMLDEAIAVCEKGLAHHPTSATALVTLGRALLQKDDRIDDAQDALERAVQLSPENLAGQRALADLYRRTGDEENELQTLQRLEMMNADDPKVSTRLAQMRGPAAMQEAAPAHEPSVPDTVRELAASVTAGPPVAVPTDGDTPPDGFPMPPASVLGTAPVDVEPEAAPVSPPPAPEPEPQPEPEPIAPMPEPVAPGPEPVAPEPEPQRSESSVPEFELPTAPVAPSAPSPVTSFDAPPVSAPPVAAPSDPAPVATANDADPTAAPAFARPSTQSPKGIGSEDKTVEVDPPIHTETMADLFMNQGHFDRAIPIYESLLKMDPDNEALRGKLESARSSLAASGRVVLDPTPPMPFDPQPGMTPTDLTPTKTFEPVPAPEPEPAPEVEQEATPDTDPFTAPADLLSAPATDMETDSRVARLGQLLDRIRSRRHTP